MKTKLQLLVIVLPCLFLLPESASGRQQVSGTVRDAEEAQPLPGVNVVVKGTTQGTATNDEGSYQLTVPSLSDTLVFTFIGYEPQEVALAGRTQVDVTLLPEVLQGEEVVVVGYGTQRKVDLTGSVAVVDPADLRESSSHTLAGALQGKVSGVAVTSSGAPGETPEVRIRGISSFGSNEPLYVIDGVPVDNIMDFNLSDIASVQVLKDAAAAAIYGTRAAKGVIIITTKRGLEERQGGLSVAYDGSIGTSNIYQRWDVLGRQDYQDLMNEMLDNAGEERAPADDPNSPFYIDDVDTDWQDTALEAGMLTQHDLTVSGANNVSAYSISAGYLGQEGHIQGPGPYYSRYSVRVNSDHTLGRFSFGESAYYAKTHTLRQESRHEVSLINNMVKAIPIMPVYDENRKGGYAGADANIERAITLNPVGVNNLLKSQDDANRFLANLWGQFRILEGLNYRLNFSYDLRDSEDYLFVPQYDMGFFFTEQNGTLDQFERRQTYTLIENTLTYERSLGRHDLNLLAGVTQEQNDYSHVGGHAEGYATSAFRTLEAATGGKTLFHWKSRNTLRSILGRITYAYADRYLMTASIRRDGSSRFGENNRYGVFPSVSLGWRISQEPFFRVPFINDLKIRGSYGQLGNQAVAARYIQQVRDRALLPNREAEFAALSQDAMRDRVGHERYLELAGEGKRFDDIRRGGWLQDPQKLSELTARDPEFGAYSPGREWLPIPQRELDTNPLLQQNTGYGG